MKTLRDMANMKFPFGFYMDILYQLIKWLQTDLNGQPNIIKYTIRDFQKTFLYVGETQQEVEHYVRFLKSNKNAIQSFVFCIGGDIIGDTKEIFSRYQVFYIFYIYLIWIFLPSQKCSGILFCSSHY
uniref:Uncharacterized protein LOC114333697 n=1 Tax=Diabrotica virgifera virgifera TaxID=50390 RepID=A0A6P7FSP7_DIAVI